MSIKSDSDTSGVSFKSFGLPTVVGIVFVILKVTGQIGWSWWWVLSPFWIPWAFYLTLAVIFGIFIAIKAVLIVVFKR